MSTTVNERWPALEPLPPELMRDRLEVERHARVLRSIVVWHLVAATLRWLRGAPRIAVAATHGPRSPAV
jgi:hypothetical protein